MIRPFMSANGDISSNDAIRAIATESGAPFLVVPTLVYRDRDATWPVQIQIRNADTGTTVATYETAPVTSSLSQQTAFRLTVTAAEQHSTAFQGKWAWPFISVGGRLTVDFANLTPRVRSAEGLDQVRRARIRGRA